MSLSPGNQNRQTHGERYKKENIVFWDVMAHSLIDNILEAVVTSRFMAEK
jgi:hypothetical protein